jgi:hypothetical protein
LTQLVDTKQQEASHADAGFRVWILFSSVFFRNTGKNTRALFCFAFSRAFQVRALSEASLVSLSSLHTRTASQARFIFQRTKRNEKERKGTKRKIGIRTDEYEPGVCKNDFPRNKKEQEGNKRIKHCCRVRQTVCQEIIGIRESAGFGSQFNHSSPHQED